VRLASGIASDARLNRSLRAMRGKDLEEFKGFKEFERFEGEGDKVL
jgi:hypothetical protein